MQRIPISRILITALPVLLSTAACGDETTDGQPLTEVIVTATHQARSPDEIAGSVSVITAEQLARSLADDLGDAIRYQPGIVMDVADRGGNEGLRIRGIGGNRVLTVIDGVRSADMYAAGPSAYGKDSFEIDDLKAVEIIRGPASVLYGADALGGVVALQTRDAADYLTTEDSVFVALRSSAASINSQLKTGVTLASQTGAFGNVLQLTRRDFKESSIKGAGSRNPQDGHSNNMFFKSRWDASAHHALTLSVDSNQETIDTQLLNELSGSVAESHGRDQTDRRRIGLRHQWQTGMLLADSITTHLNWQRTDADQQTSQQRISYSFVNPQNPATFGGTEASRLTSLQFNQETASALLLARTASLVYGLSLEQTDTERPRDRRDIRTDTGAISRAIASYPMASPEMFPNKTFPDTRTRRVGVFAQQEFSLLNDALVVIPGLRYDHYRMDPRPDAMFSNAGDISDWGGFSVKQFSENNVSANLGVLYAPHDNISLFAQYAEGFRPPNFDEANQAFVNLGHGYATIPNPALNAETSQAVEAGVRTRLNRLAFSVAAFNNQYTDFIESSLIGIQNGIMLFQDANVGKARIYGIEANMDWSVSESLHWRTALSWSRGRDQSAATELDSVDPFTVVTGIRYQPAQQWAIEGIATLVAARTRVASADQMQGDAYQVLDVVGHYTLMPNATLRLGVFNLLDQKYTPWSRLRGITTDDTTTLANNRAAGINARVALDFTF